MVHSYIRFSPSKDSGLALSLQMNANLAIAWGEFKSVPMFFVDADKTGRFEHMTQFLRLREAFKTESSPVLIIDRLERLGSSKEQLQEFLTQCSKTQTQIWVRDALPLLNNKNCIGLEDWGKISIDAIADWIVGRHDAAVQKIKARVEFHQSTGRAWGRKKVEIAQDKLENAEKRQRDGVPLTEIASELGVPYSVLRRRLDDAQAAKDQKEQGQIPQLEGKS